MHGLAEAVFMILWLLGTQMAIVCAILSTAWFFPDRRRAETMVKVARVTILAEHGLLLLLPSFWIRLMAGGTVESHYYFPPSPIFPLTGIALFLPLLPSRPSGRWVQMGVRLLRIALLVLFVVAPSFILGWGWFHPTGAGGAAALAAIVVIGLTMAMFLYDGDHPVAVI